MDRALRVEDSQGCGPAVARRRAGQRHRLEPEILRRDRPRGAAWQGRCGDWSPWRSPSAVADVRGSVRRPNFVAAASAGGRAGRVRCQHATVASAPACAGPLLRGAGGRYDPGRRSEPRPGLQRASKRRPAAARSASSAAGCQKAASAPARRGTGAFASTACFSPTLRSA